MTENGGRTVIRLTDIPRWLLTMAVRRMPAERSDRGEAMLAELAQLHETHTFIWFGLSLFLSFHGIYIAQDLAVSLIELNGVESQCHRIGLPVSSEASKTIRRELMTYSNSAASFFRLTTCIRSGYSE
jgi:hypothetical protein